MKKFLVILMALAMVLSASAFASAADSSVGKFVPTSKGGSMSAIQVNFNTPYAQGATISFEFKTEDLTDWNGLSIRTLDHAAKMFDLKYENDAYSVVDTAGGAAEAPNIADVKLTDLGDGWMKVEWKSGAAADGFWVRFYWADAHYTGAGGSECVAYIDNLVVDGKTCSFTSANAVSLEENNAGMKFDDGTEFSLVLKTEQLNWMLEIEGAAPGGDTTGGDTTGGDTTGGDTTGTTATPKPASTSTTTTKTGVVSAAVVAAAAVLGGAVVLKKKEF